MISWCGQGHLFPPPSTFANKTSEREEAEGKSVTIHVIRLVTSICDRGKKQAKLSDDISAAQQPRTRKAASVP